MSTSCVNLGDRLAWKSHDTRKVYIKSPSVCKGDICHLSRITVYCHTQLSWKSGKFQLARWSHNVALFWGNHPPPIQPPTCRTPFSYRSNDYWEPVLMCGVLGYWPPVQRVFGVPLPLPIGTLFLKYVRCPRSRYTLFLCGVPPPNFDLCLEHFRYVLDFEQNWESGKFHSLQDEAKLNLYPRVWHL